MRFPRSSGILLHPTSLPGRYGIGDLGQEASHFVDFLVAAQQSLWQILPLGPTGYGDSPYQGLSAVAGNPLLISPDVLVADGLLTPEEVRDVPSFPAEQVAFSAVIPFKHEILARAARRVALGTHGALSDAFATFRARRAAWLDDFAILTAFKNPLHTIQAEFAFGLFRAMALHARVVKNRFDIARVSDAFLIGGSGNLAEVNLVLSFLRAVEIENG